MQLVKKSLIVFSLQKGERGARKLFPGIMDFAILISLICQPLCLEVRFM